MRIALVGWDLDDQMPSELAKLGAEVVGITRWFPDYQSLEPRDGWIRLRCAHRLGGTAEEEASAFGVAVIREASTLGIGFDFDIVHALDHRALAAASELRARAQESVFLASLSAAEDEAGVSDASSRQTGVQAWICDHPWVAESLRARLHEQVPVRVVPTDAALRMTLARKEVLERALDEPSTNFVAMISNAVHVSPRVLIAAVKRVREMVRGLRLSVCGIGSRAELLRRRLEAQGLLHESWAATTVPSLSRWNASVAQAAVVGVDSRCLSENPVAQFAWLVGRPVVRLSNADAESLARDLHDAIRDPIRRDRDVTLAAAQARRNLEPEAVAAAWVRVYLDAVAARAPPSNPGSSSLLEAAGVSRSSVPAYAYSGLAPRGVGLLVAVRG